MKLGQLLLFLFVFTYNSKAQTNKAKEPELTREQKWLMDKMTSFYKQKGEDASSKAYLQNFKKVLVTNQFCKTTVSSTSTLELEGDRLNTGTALLLFNVTNEAGGEKYIIERRYNNPFGKFDSVGTVAGSSAEAALSSYRFIDNNDHVGKTWYRIRRAGSSDDKQLVCIEGYNNNVNVYPNPVTSPSLQVKIKQFKTDDNTNLMVLDGNGRIVYTQSKVFVDHSNTVSLRNLNLTPGTYHVRVVNKFNSGGASFVVR